MSCLLMLNSIYDGEYKTIHQVKEGQQKSPMDTFAYELFLFL